MDDNDNGWTYRDDPGWTYLCEIEWSRACFSSLLENKSIPGRGAAPAPRERSRSPGGFPQFGRGDGGERSHVNSGNGYVGWLINNDNNYNANIYIYMLIHTRWQQGLSQALWPMCHHPWALSSHSMWVPQLNCDWCFVTWLRQSSVAWLMQYGPDWWHPNVMERSWTHQVEEGTVFVALIDLAW